MTAKLAFVFPGQGSQSVGMLDELASGNPVVRGTFSEASDALGLDLWRLVSMGPKEELDLTHNTQPAMLASGVAVWRLWQERGGAPPAWMAGHSLGEYSALVCADALTFADGVRLVAERGRLMQESVSEGTGAMAAVLGLADDVVRAACAEAAQGQVVEAVNFNAPGQVVVAGQAEAVARATEIAKRMGAKRAVVLPVSVPSHCALMQTAAERLGERLAAVTIRFPSVPVLHNVSVDTASDPDRIRALLVQQLYQPVRWVETIQRLSSEAVGTVVELGPGKILTGLVKRIDKSLEAIGVFDSRSLDSALEVTRDA
jgi:[acyl-carrier-protein] S-malonyltransferase